jgi:hypothetical protein
MHRLQELVRLHRLGTGAGEAARLPGLGPNTERWYREAPNANPAPTRTESCLLAAESYTPYVPTRFRFPGRPLTASASGAQIAQVARKTRIL